MGSKKLYELTAKGRYYKVFLGETYISQHTTEREAVERAVEVKLENPEERVYYVHDYEVEVGLTDAGITVAVDVTPPTDQPPTITSTPSVSFIFGTADSYDFSQHVSDDGLSALSYSLTNTIPNGMTLNASTGVLTYDGVEPESVSAHQLVATDAVGSDTSASFNISILGFSLSTIPNLSLNANTTWDMSQYITDDNNLVTTSSILNLDPAVGTYSHATKLLTAGSSAGSDTGLIYRIGTPNIDSNTFNVTVNKMSQGAEADFTARVSQSGVVWWHGFQNDDEVNNFRVAAGSGTDRNDVFSTDGGSCTRITSDASFPNGCMEVYWPEGVDGPTDQWWRPFAPFSGAINGKGEDDPGGGIAVATSGYDPNSIGAYDIENKWNWTHPDLADPDTIGHGFYIQFRMKLPSSRFVAGQPPGKYIYIDATNSNNQELVIQPSNTYFTMYTNFGRAHGVLHDPQGWQLSPDWTGDYGIVNSLQPGNEYGASGYFGNYWSPPVDEWSTILFHIIPGEGKDTIEGWGGQGPTWAQMQEKLADPDFGKTQIRVWAAASDLLNGSEAYTKIWDKNDYIWSYDSDTEAGRAFNYLKFAAYSNGVVSTAETYHRIAEVIFSQDPILCPQATPTPLEERTRALQSANTPVLNTHYFRSTEGSPAIPNNTSTSQGEFISWQIEGIYYDPIRRRMHQLDRQHSGPPPLEHSYLDEVTNTWQQVTGVPGGQPPGHWRACNFDPETGKFFWQREGTDDLYIYDPESGWSVKDSGGFLTANGNPGNAGFHPNLFGPGRPGVLTGSYVGGGGFVGYDIYNDTWHDLNQSGEPSANIFGNLYTGWSTYLPGNDELIMVNNSGATVAFAAGTGLETNLSTSNSASVRNTAPKGFENPGGAGVDFCYACKHPRQRNVILAIYAGSGTVYYTEDGATTPWQTAPFTHPFYSEFGASNLYTVGSLPYHGVVAGAQASGTNNTKFVYWRPPLV